VWIVHRREPLIAGVRRIKARTITMRNDSRPNLWVIASVFLNGVVIGIAAFAIWAERSGHLKPSALYAMLFPFVVLGSLILASLPMCVPQFCEAVRRFSASRERCEAVFRQSERFAAGLAEPTDAMDSR
jgi:hypothetical protein